MGLRKSFRKLSSLVTQTAVGAVAFLGVSMQATMAEPVCPMPMDLVRLDYALPHLAEKFAKKEPVTIIAIGSSSTAGYGTTGYDGATSPAAYPGRLQQELSQKFPDVEIKVMNKGVGGNVLSNMLARFDRDVLRHKVDLVIWQLDTNSVVKRLPFGVQREQIPEGIQKIRAATGADVILVDPQYAKDVIEQPGALPMEDLIKTAAKQEKTNLFRRYDLMQHWMTVGNLDFKDFTISWDGLHTNDWGHACMAKEFAAAIEEAAKRPLMTVGLRPELSAPFFGVP
jgi:lysophospholipase L1-like esterase